MWVYASQYTQAKSENHQRQTEILYCCVVCIHSLWYVLVFVFQYSPKCVCVFCNYNFITGFMFVLWANRRRKKTPSYTKTKNVFYVIFIASMLFDILNRAYGNAKCANISATSFSVHYKTECIYSVLCRAALCRVFFGCYILILSPLLDCWSWKSIEQERTGETRTQTSSIFTYNFLQFK